MAGPNKAAKKGLRQQINNQSSNKSNSRTFIDVPMVSLLVGQNETLFNIHRDILCHASPFFTSAFMGSGAGEFEEKSTQSMNLPEEDPDTIDYLVQWIYAKRFPFDTPFDAKAREKSQNIMIPVMQLAILYVAADKYDIIELKNDVIDQLWQLSGKTRNKVEIKDEIIEYIYENTIAGSRLRKLLVLWQANSAGSPSLLKKNMMKLVGDYPEYAADLLAEFSKRHSVPMHGGYTSYQEVDRFEENSDTDGGIDEDDDDEG
ncbi:MAG: hypothetical protein Q9195_008614 [Heterodermia aff. obscurata]